MGKLSIGRNESVTTEFLVSLEVTQPIIGIGALARVDLTIDCASQEIMNNKTRDILLCTVVVAEKN